MKAAIQLLKENRLSTGALSDGLSSEKVQLVLGFGQKDLLADKSKYRVLREMYPGAAILLCSTAGEIFDARVLDDTLSIAAVEFEKTRVKPVCTNIAAYANSFEAGKFLASGFSTDELCYLLVLSDGSLVNGSELVRGISEITKNRIPVSGGLAGDAGNFTSTLVGLNDDIASGNIVAIGFYGKALKVGHGSMGGWDLFGPEKEVSKSSGNVLYEIDGKNALDLYKTYLGKYSNELPGSALLFPLSVTLPGSDTTVVRTILSINEEEKTMTFAGDIPEHSQVRFMKANFDRIVHAAGIAAKQTLALPIDNPPKLALLISCVGRKLILNNRIEEEVEAVNMAFQQKTLLTGFYSYGEISTLPGVLKCELHNQTMTITTFDEA
ncbi:MAG: FIST C-terminal domain-containing protein [Bacteroidota bacterium]|nr:FIST C-terminal domain-containing protein [Bacteroidota bacterium]